MVVSQDSKRLVAPDSARRVLAASLSFGDNSSSQSDSLETSASSGEGEDREQ